MKNLQEKLNHWKQFFLIKKKRERDVTQDLCTGLYFMVTWSQGIGGVLPGLFRQELQLLLSVISSHQNKLINWAWTIFLVAVFSFGLLSLGPFICASTAQLSLTPSATLGKTKWHRSCFTSLLTQNIDQCKLDRGQLLCPQRTRLNFPNV